jgi:Tetratricopeptide repeat
MRGERGRALKVALAPRSTEDLLEGGGRDVFERESEDVAMGPETVEGPGEIGLDGHGESTAGRDDAEKDAGAVCALGASGEEHVESELGDVLELALGGRVVDGNVGVVDESEERVAVSPVVLHGDHQRLRRQERRDDGVEPSAWLISLKPENQPREKIVRSIRMLDKAIAMSDQCERAYFWRGMLYKRVGRIEAAYRDFHEAVELNPDNIDAVREMRLHNMRSGTRSRPSVPAALPPRPSPPRGPSAKRDDKTSLFSRFFKKG